MTPHTPAKSSEPESAPPSTRSVGKKRTVLLLLTAAVLSLGCMAIGARGEYRLGPGTVRMEVRPDLQGRTVLSVPPFGTVSADTHQAPLRVQLSPQSVSPSGTQELVESRPSQQQLMQDLREQLVDGVRRLTWRVGLSGLLGGLLAALLFRARSARQIVGAALAGTLLPLLLYGATFAQYDADAFRQPTLTGALSMSPDLLGPVQQFGDRFRQLRSELYEISTITFSLHQFLAQQSPIPPDAIRVLHISDLHLNPVGFDVAEQVAERFDVALVIDSGDLTAEGTELESAFAERIAEFSVPYVFVRGNHDSEATAATVAAAPNGLVLDGELVSVAGLKVFGVGDPLFTPDKSVEQPSTREQIRAKRRFASTVAEQVADLDTVPDVTVVHDSLIAGRITGQVPLVIFGHSHRFEDYEHRDTRMLAVASTGAAGLKSLDPDSDSFIGAQVLYFERDSRRLLGYDRIEVQGPQQEFRLSRTVVTDPDEPEEPEPEPEERIIPSPG